jgi:hypothetical protein
MATITPDVGREVALDRIRVPENVRVLDDAHVQALVGSISLQRDACAGRRPRRR